MSGLRVAAGRASRAPLTDLAGIKRSSCIWAVLTAGPATSGRSWALHLTTWLPVSPLNITRPYTQQEQCQNYHSWHAVSREGWRGNRAGVGDVPARGSRNAYGEEPPGHHPNSPGSSPQDQVTCWHRPCKRQPRCSTVPSIRSRRESCAGASWRPTPRKSYRVPSPALACSHAHTVLPSTMAGAASGALRDMLSVQYQGSIRESMWLPLIPAWLARKTRPHRNGMRCFHVDGPAAHSSGLPSAGEGPKSP